MNPDHALLFAAARYAGEHVHAVSQWMTIYELGCSALDREHRPQQRAELERAVAEAEQRLRTFVAHRRLIA